MYFILTVFRKEFYIPDNSQLDDHAYQSLLRPFCKTNILSALCIVESL